ncbi:MAG: DUF805 domain-containing protein [Elusimicrobiaceae bacterium]|nr:DUF805 domain-containing protein [Elusimicrobiaceae bacterium]
MDEYFLDVLKNQYADFRSRATRKQYWLFILWYCLILGATQTVFIFLPIVSQFLTFVLLLITTTPFTAIFVRRVRDAGHNPYWGLLIIPNILWCILNIFLYVLGIVLSISGKVEMCIYFGQQCPISSLVNIPYVKIVLVLIGIPMSLCLIPYLIFCLLPSKK